MLSVKSALSEICEAEPPNDLPTWVARWEGKVYANSPQTLRKGRDEEGKTENAVYTGTLKCNCKAFATAHA